MAGIRPQQYRLNFPLTAPQVESIDTMFETLFKGVRKLEPSVPVIFANLPTVNVGTLATVLDSTTVTWGATITGGGTNTVLAFYNGSAWTVVGK